MTITPTRLGSAPSRRLAMTLNHVSASSIGRQRRRPADDAALRDDHLDHRGVELREVARRAVGDEQAFVAAVVGLAHRRLHADLGGHAADQQVGDARACRMASSAGGVEGALARLAQHDVAGLRRSSGTKPAPGSPATSTRPSGPGSPMPQLERAARALGAAGSRRAARSCASCVWITAMPCARASASSRAQAGTMGRSSDDVVAQHRAEAAGLEEVALHVDHQRPRCAPGRTGSRRGGRGWSCITRPPRSACGCVPCVHVAGHGAADRADVGVRRRRTRARHGRATAPPGARRARAARPGPR